MKKKLLKYEIKFIKLFAVKDQHKNTFINRVNISNYPAEKKYINLHSMIYQRSIINEMSDKLSEKERSI